MTCPVVFSDFLKTKSCNERISTSQGGLLGLLLEVGGASHRRRGHRISGIQKENGAPTIILTHACHACYPRPRLILLQEHLSRPLLLSKHPSLARGHTTGGVATCLCTVCVLSVCCLGPLRSREGKRSCHSHGTRNHLLHSERDSIPSQREPDLRRAAGSAVPSGVGRGRRKGSGRSADSRTSSL